MAITVILYPFLWAGKIVLFDLICYYSIRLPIWTAGKLWMLEYLVHIAGELMNTHILYIYIYTCIYINIYICIFKIYIYTMYIYILQKESNIVAAPVLSRFAGSLLGQFSCRAIKTPYSTNWFTNSLWQFPHEL